MFKKVTVIKSESNKIFLKLYSARCLLSFGSKIHYISLAAANMLFKKIFVFNVKLFFNNNIYKIVFNLNFK